MPRQPVNSTTMGPLPMPPLNLEEVKFWLDIMREHALFIKAGLPCDNTALIDEAQTFYQEFNALYLRAERASNSRRFAELAADAHNSVRDFYRFKIRLLHMKLILKLEGSNYPLLLDHMAREALYFLRLLDKMGDGNLALVNAIATHEMTFWLRIMSDHTQFVDHLLDPSERLLIQTTRNFAQEFNDLFLESRDLVSMLNGFAGTTPVFGRFVLDARTAVVRLRNFKRAFHTLIVDGRVITLAPAQLADHIRREADHFLMVLTMMDKGMMKTVSPARPDFGIGVVDGTDPLEAEGYGIASEADVSAVVSEEASPAPTSAPNFTPSPSFVHLELDEEDEDDAINEADAAIEAAAEDDSEEEDDDLPEFIPEPPSVKKTGKPDKYKWSDKWPRPLGKKTE